MGGNKLNPGFVVCVKTGLELLSASTSGSVSRCCDRNTHLIPVAELNTCSSPGPKGKCAVKTLPKIKENLEVTQGSLSSNQRSAGTLSYAELSLVYRCFACRLL